MSSLTRLGDVARIDDFLSTVSAKGTYAGGDNAALVGATALLPPQRGAELVELVVLRNAYLLPGACANLLARMADLPQSPEMRALLDPAAQALTETLLGTRVNTHPMQPWQHPTPIDPALVDDLLYTLARVDAPALAACVVDYALANPAKFGLDAILVPTALKLVQRVQMRDDVAAERIRHTCLRHVRVRINEALAPPADFVRPCALVCRCAHCAELSRFLADPVRQEWAFRAAEVHRRHVEASVRQGRCDLDLTTRKTGSPHSLIATKNQASYERRVIQRKDDLAILARLDLTHDT